MSQQQFAVLGLGRFGTTVARGLYEAGAEVVAVDEGEEVVAQIQNHVTTALRMNATSAETLQTLGIPHFDAVIVAIGKDVEASILVTALARQQGARHLVARASSHLHAQILELVGAHEVVYPEHDAALRVTHKLTSPGLLERIDLPGKLELAVLEAPRALVGRSLRQLDLRNRHGVTVLAVEGAHEDGSLHLPHADYVFAAGDRVYLVGESEGIQTVCALG